MLKFVQKFRSKLDYCPNCAELPVIKPHDGCDCQQYVAVALVRCDRCGMLRGVHQGRGWICHADGVHRWAQLNRSTRIGFGRAYPANLNHQYLAGFCTGPHRSLAIRYTLSAFFDHRLGVRFDQRSAGLGASRHVVFGQFGWADRMFLTFATMRPWLARDARGA